MARQSEGAWYRRGKNVWCATVNGKTVSLGVRGEQNRAAAQEAWHRLMANLPITSHAVAIAPAPDETITAGTLVDAFLADVAVRVKANTLATYTGLLAPFKAQFGTTPAAAVTPTGVIRFSQRDGWGSSHRHNLIGAVCTAYKWAESSGLIPVNPLKAVKRPSKHSRGTKAVIGDDTYRKLLHSATPLLRQLLTLLYETGARPSELARLTAADLDLAAGVAMLRDHKTAGSSGRPRLIVLTPAAKDALAALVREHPSGPLLRNSRGGAWTKDGIGLAVRRACRRAGVTATAYGFRHTFATAALAKGVPDATVAALLGHSSTAMLHKHYSHLTSQAAVLRSAVAQVRPGPTEPAVG